MLPSRRQRSPPRPTPYPPRMRSHLRRQCAAPARRSTGGMYRYTRRTTYRSMRKAIKRTRTTCASPPLPPQPPRPMPRALPRRPAAYLRATAGAAWGIGDIRGQHRVCQKRCAGRPLILVNNKHLLRQQYQRSTQATQAAVRGSKPATFSRP